MSCKLNKLTGVMCDDVRLFFAHDTTSPTHMSYYDMCKVIFSHRQEKKKQLITISKYKTHTLRTFILSRYGVRTTKYSTTFRYCTVLQIIRMMNLALLRHPNSYFSLFVQSVCTVPVFRLLLLFLRPTYYFFFFFFCFYFFASLWSSTPHHGLKNFPYISTSTTRSSTHRVLACNGRGA